MEEKMRKQKKGKQEAAEKADKEKKNKKKRAIPKPVKLLRNVKRQLR